MTIQSEKIAGVDPAQLRPWLKGQSFADARRRFDRDGYVIFENVLSQSELRAYRAALRPFLEQDVSGRNPFEGYRTHRVYALLAKDPVFAEMATHPLALAFAEADLGTSCLLSAMLAINLQPGETVQPWHHDDANIQIPTPRPSFGVSTFWALDDTTEDNGATELVPGSHRMALDDILAQNESSYQTGSKEVAGDPLARSDAIKAVMPKGSLMIAKGNLLHRGGANTTQQPRLIVTPQYCPGWARQLENQLLAIPPERAATLPLRAQQLIGYSIHGTFMGYVDGRHPMRAMPKTGLTPE